MCLGDIAGCSEWSNFVRRKCPWLTLCAKGVGSFVEVHCGWELNLSGLSAKGQCATWDNTSHVKMDMCCENPNHTVSALHYSLLHLGILI